MESMTTLKLLGPRQVEVIEWMLGKATPEEVDPEGEVWSGLGVSLADGVLSIPTRLLAHFIDECGDGVQYFIDWQGDQGWEDEVASARACERALRTVIKKLDAL